MIKFIYAFYQLPKTTPYEFIYCCFLFDQIEVSTLKVVYQEREKTEIMKIQFFNCKNDNNWLIKFNNCII